MSEDDFQRIHRRSPIYIRQFRAVAAPRAMQATTYEVDAATFHKLLVSEVDMVYEACSGAPAMTTMNLTRIFARETQLLRFFF